MQFYGDRPLVKRAQPWLGTLVSIGVTGLAQSRAQEAIGAAFAEVATVDRHMSFHKEMSDVSRLNREAVHGPVTVHPYTFEVLRWALWISAASGGCFDISVGSQLVEWGLLPPPSSPRSELRSTWRDIELHEDGWVRFHQPLWIDLGGIAKGYAVDRAIDCLCRWEVERAVVNAGGDLRVQGPHAGADWFATGNSKRRDAPARAKGRQLGQQQWPSESLSGSGPALWPARAGNGGYPAPTDRFVCVVAEQCIVADALTKVVMAEGAQSRDVLRHFGASAHWHDPGAG